MNARTIAKPETAWAMLKGGWSLKQAAHEVRLAPDVLGELLWRWWTPKSGRGAQVDV